MYHLLWEFAHWIGVTLVVVFGLLVFLGFRDYEKERHEAYKYGPRKPRPYIGRSTRRGYQLYRVDGEGVANGEPEVYEDFTDESEYVPGFERWGNLDNPPGLHDNPSGHGGDGSGWN